MGCADLWRASMAKFNFGHISENPGENDKGGKATELLLEVTLLLLRGSGPERCQENHGRMSQAAPLLTYSRHASGKILSNKSELLPLDIPLQ